MLAAQACARRHGGHEGIAHAIYPAVPGDAVAVERSHKAVALSLHGQHSMSDVHINQSPMVMHIVVQFRVRNRDLRLAQKCATKNNEHRNNLFHNIPMILMAATVAACLFV